jgi:Dullard-like phosphatase family protein
MPLRFPKKTLVLDLDETLVHCKVSDPSDAEDGGGEVWDVHFPVVFDGGKYQIHARKRPHVDHFLKRASQLFEVVVFTSSRQAYADRMLDILDPEKKYIRHRLYRESCLSYKGNYIKDLALLGRDMKKVVLVDNAVPAYAYHVGNGIPIISWFRDPEDRELLDLLPFLESLVPDTVRDVRVPIHDTFATQKKVDAEAEKKRESDLPFTWEGWDKEKEKQDEDKPKASRWADNDDNDDNDNDDESGVATASKETEDAGKDTPEKASEGTTQWVPKPLIDSKLIDDGLPPPSIGPMAHVPSQTLVIHRMFDPDDVGALATEGERGQMLTNIEFSVGEECQKYGVVLGVDAFKDGSVGVKFKETKSAQQCCSVMDGRFFDERKLYAEFEHSPAENEQFRFAEMQRQAKEQTAMLQRAARNKRFQEAGMRRY